MTPGTGAVSAAEVVPVPLTTGGGEIEKEKTPGVPGGPTEPNTSNPPVVPSFEESQFFPDTTEGGRLQRLVVESVKGSDFRFSQDALLGAVSGIQGIGTNLRRLCQILILHIVIGSCHQKGTANFNSRIALSKNVAGQVFPNE